MKWNCPAHPATISPQSFTLSFTEFVTFLHLFSYFFAALFVCVPHSVLYCVCCVDAVHLTGQKCLHQPCSTKFLRRFYSFRILYFIFILHIPSLSLIHNAIFRLQVAPFILKNKNDEQQLQNQLQRIWWIIVRANRMRWNFINSDMHTIIPTDNWQAEIKTNKQTENKLNNHIILGWKMFVPLRHILIKCVGRVWAIFICSCCAMANNMCST